MPDPAAETMRRPHVGWLVGAIVAMVSFVAGVTALVMYFYDLSHTRELAQAIVDEKARVAVDRSLWLCAAMAGAFGVFGLFAFVLGAFSFLKTYSTRGVPICGVGCGAPPQDPPVDGARAPAQLVTASTSGLEKFCRHLETTILGSQHECLILADNCEQLAQRIQTAISAAREEWWERTMKSDIGTADLTRVMRDLMMRKESECKLRGPSSLYRIGIHEPRVAEFLNETSRICADFHTEVVACLADGSRSHRQRHDSCMEAVNRLSERASDLFDRSRAIAAGLRQEAHATWAVLQSKA